MNKQEIFDTVSTHLIKQKRKSAVGGFGTTCYYHGPNGLKCAIGCLISDDVYNPKMEHQSVGGLINNFPLIPNYFKHDVQFLIALQNAHDCCFARSPDYVFDVNNLKHNLYSVAKTYELNTNILL